MRPLHLQIKGIGPFAEEERIPFDQLGVGGLYLITGDTGAGKTTIFDAVCFALFGEASGDVRGTGSLRSDYAAPSQESLVSFTFLQNGKEYCVTRNPAYQRPRLRGQGTTLQAAGASLNLPDGTIIEGEKEVTRRIETILGLDRSQFKQTSMIAQGEFLKLLLADTKKRSEIFRKIFGTGLYSNLQDRLRQETAERKKQCETTELSIRQYISGIQLVAEEDDCEATVNLRKMIDQIVKNGSLDQAESLPAVLSQWIRQRKETLQQLVGESEALDQTGQKLTEALTHVSQENRQHRQYESERQLYEHHLEQAGEQEEKQQFLDRAEQVAAICQPAWNRQKQAAEQLLRQKQRYQETEQRKNQLAERLPLLRAAWEESRQGEEERQQLRENLARRKAELPGRRELLAAQSRWKKEIQRILQEREESQLRYEEKEACYRQKSEQYEQIQLQFYRQQAGLLAAKLESGAPCPVCGSTVHPCLARITGQAVEKDQVDRAQAEKENALEQLQQLSLLRQEQQTHLAQLQERSRETDIQLNGWDEERMITEEKELRSLEQDLLSQEKKAAENKKAWEACEKQLLPLEGELENQKKQIEDAEKEKAEADIAWMHSLTAADLADETEYQKYVLSQAERKKRQQACQEYRDQGITLQARLQRLQEVMEEAERIRRERKYEDLIKETKAGDPSGAEGSHHIEELENALREQWDTVMAHRRQIQNLRTGLTQRIAANESIQKKLTAQFEKRGAQIREWELYADLSRTAGGEIKGQERLALEQYVQAFYFEQIVDRANRRFHEMSAGRYQLGRKQEASSLRSKAGLDLEVMDYYTGKRRPVNSLSGGEAFQASLCLALGLSDVVQSMAGGIRIEAMFVDEGFGSLDREAMDLAVSTLKGLAEENFLVGIISHVDELKERIERKILVEKGNEGSHIKLI